MTKRTKPQPGVQRRSLGGSDLTFEWKDNRLLDIETGSEWDLLTGTAMTLPLKGKRLEQCRGIISLHHAWLAFHPNSSYWSPSKKRGHSDAVNDTRR